MPLCDQIVISAPPDAVWPRIADPVLMAEWNPKLVAIDRDADGPVRLGEHYSALYRMSGRDRESTVEVIACEPPRRLVLRHTFTTNGRTRVAVESYELIPQDDGSRLEQSVDLSQAGIPAPFRLVFGLIHRFGRSAEEPYLERLRALAEDDPREHTPGTTPSGNPGPRST